MSWGVLLAEETSLSVPTSAMKRPSGDGSRCLQTSESPPGRRCTRDGWCLQRTFIAGLRDAKDVPAPESQSHQP